jgi:hypothetical protein
MRIADIGILRTVAADPGFLVRPPWKPDNQPAAIRSYPGCQYQEIIYYGIHTISGGKGD